MQHDIDRQWKPDVAHQRRSFKLSRMSGSAGDGIRKVAVIRLEADLHAVQPGIAKRASPLRREADRAGDQVGIKPGGAGGGDEIFQVLAGQRLAAGEEGMQDADACGLVQDPTPGIRREFLAAGGILHRIGTIGTVQRTAIGQFRDQAKRPRGR